MATKFRPDGLPQGGRRTGGKNKLTTAFLEALAADFAEGGPAAIKVCRIEHPDRYIAIISQLMPKELTVEHTTQFAELSDEEIDAVITHARMLRAS